MAEINECINEVGWRARFPYDYSNKDGWRARFPYEYSDKGGWRAICPYGGWQAVHARPPLYNDRS
jgi:hypothetical protein